MAKIEFARGIDESAVPDVKLRKSRDGQQGSALFYFDKPDILAQDQTEAVTGMYLLDEEGEIVVREVKGKFVNGKPAALEAIHRMESTAEWDRFMRFMERYAAAKGLGFSSAAPQEEAQSE
jgi:photosystem II 13kDa protein